MTLYTLSIYPTVHKPLIRTLFEAHIVCESIIQGMLKKKIRFINPYGFTVYSNTGKAAMDYGFCDYEMVCIINIETTQPIYYVISL